VCINCSFFTYISIIAVHVNGYEAVQITSVPSARGSGHKLCNDSDPAGHDIRLMVVRPGLYHLVVNIK